jgi:hypothetical protein
LLNLVQDKTLDKLSSWVKFVASLLSFYLLRSIKCCDANLGVQPTLRKDNKFSFLKIWDIPTNPIWTYKCGALTFKLNNCANIDYQIINERNWIFPNGIGLSKILEFTTRNHVHSNPCVCNLCPNQSILYYRCNCPLWHLVKLIYSYITNYKVVYSCICDLDLWLMSIWMKMKMKKHIYHPFWMASQNRWKCSCFCNLKGGFLGN